MNKLLNIISVILIAVSCSTTSLDKDNPGSDIITNIEGSVTDTLGNPIEHIKVTITIPDLDDLTVYSGSDGKFTAKLNIDGSEQQFIDVRIEDIDGEENGGYFATKTDRITIIPDDSNGEPFRLQPVYRLNLATVEENSQQI